MSAALAIFVKTPGLSPIKTRLAQTLGDAAAIEFHRRACVAVAAAADAATRAGLPIVAYWAVAERVALESDEWSGLPRLWQGEGDLGTRLDAVHTVLQARHGTALLFGADTPQLSVELLAQALAALGHLAVFPPGRTRRGTPDVPAGPHRAVLRRCRVTHHRHHHPSGSPS